MMNKGVILKNHPKQCICCILFEGNHFKITSSSSFWSLQRQFNYIWWNLPSHHMDALPRRSFTGCTFQKGKRWDPNHWFFEFHVFATKKTSDTFHGLFNREPCNMDYQNPHRTGWSNPLYTVLVTAHINFRECKASQDQQKGAHKYQKANQLLSSSPKLRQVLTSFEWHQPIIAFKKNKI